MNVRVTIDYGICASCKQCLRSCSFGVFEWLDDTPLVANPKECNACLDCEKNCPVNALGVAVS